MHNSYSHSDSLHAAFDTLDKTTILSVILISKNISITGNHNLKPLHRAAEIGDIDIINALLNRGAHIDIQKMNVDKWTPLCFALKKGHVNAVKLLLEKGSSVEHLTINKDTVMHLACSSGDIDTVVTIYNAGGYKFINQLNNLEKSPLHCAIANQHYPVMEFLLEKNASIGCSDKQNFTCLHEASRVRDIRFLELLFRYGAKHFIHVKSEKSFLYGSETPFLSAVRARNVLGVKYLLENGANINDVNYYGETCLHLLVANRCYRLEDYQLSMELAAILYQYGAKALVNHSDTNNRTPVHLAAENFNIKLLFLFLENISEEILKQKEKENYKTPLELLERYRSYDLYGSSLVEHALNSSHIQFFLNDKTVQLPVYDEMPQLTPLLDTIYKVLQKLVLEALKNNNLVLLEKIVEKINPNDVCKFVNRYNQISYHNYYGRTFLFIAAETGNIEAVEWLLKHNATPSLRCYRENDKKDKLSYVTPLGIAVLKGDLAIVKCFFENTDIDFTTHDLIDVTHLKIKSGKNLLPNQIFMSGLEIKNTANRIIPLLHLAIIKLNYPMIKFLLTKVNEIELLRATGIGYTPLLQAIRKNDIEAVNLLAINTRIVNQLTDKKSPLILASVVAKKEIVRILLERGAEIELSNAEGVTPLMAALMQNNIENATLLLNADSKANVVTSKGFTPIMISASKGYVELLPLLIKKGADITTKREILFNFACQSGCLATVSFFLERDFDVNGKIESGITPILTASKHKHSKIVKALIDAGADFNYQLPSLVSAMSLTLENADCETFLVLIKAGFQLKPIRDSRSFDKLVKVATKEGHTEILQVLIDSGFCFESSEVKEQILPTKNAIDLIIGKTTFDGKGFSQKENKTEYIVNSPGGLTLLFLAIKHHRLDMIKLLASAKADVNQVQLYYGDIKYLIDDYLNPNLVDNYSDSSSDSSDEEYDSDENDFEEQEYTLSPLLAATLIGNYKIAETLIQIGANVNQLMNFNGVSSLHIVLNRLNKEPFEEDTFLKEDTLLDEDVSLEKNELPEEDESFEEDELLEEINHIKFLINSGANINQLCVLSRKENKYFHSPTFTTTPIYTAFLKNSLNVMRLLLNSGAEAGIELVNLGVCKEPIIYQAARKGNAEVVELLLQYGFMTLPTWVSRFAYDEAAQIGKKIIYSYNHWKTTTPLHVAAENGCEKVVKILIKYHPDLCFVKDKQKMTAQELAEKKGYNELANYLKERASMLRKSKDMNLLERFRCKFFMSQTYSEKDYTDVDISIYDKNLKF